MKKEEFPTFLNEQPAIIFGRTGRELLVITIGLALSYLLWLRLGILIHGNVIASDIVKGLIAAILVIIAVIVAFVKIATRPLEEWAFVWFFYLLVPKVYLYAPAEVSITSDGADDTQEEKEKNPDDDDFDD